MCKLREKVVDKEPIDTYNIGIQRATAPWPSGQAISIHDTHGSPWVFSFVSICLISCLISPVQGRRLSGGGGAGFFNVFFTPGFFFHEDVVGVAGDFGTAGGGEAAEAVKAAQELREVQPAGLMCRRVMSFICRRG